VFLTLVQGLAAPISPATEVIMSFWHIVNGIFMYVSLPSLLPCLYATTQSQPYASSWEFFTTLGFEWNVIWGRCPYRWMILVCRFLSGFVLAHTITDDL
jgi:hypothetical protein